MTGRPTKYAAALADIIYERIADGENLRSICRDDAMPAKSTVRAWPVASIECHGAAPCVHRRRPHV
ncbi:hypothetical protein ACCS54_35855 [Rhizobium johnstonii]|uniref:terminase small subunit-like protein n=1 Tax=Rhizobium johnstonii TaxID=3019933 RepID=UPI003F94E95A